ncbi:thioredoxin family protein [Bremerella sp. JC770]|uniref:thioredoxin family protein n=1 Tax=Bremerella sp. JC770 TaxID=3232137 RepID=UPI003459CE23
MKACVQTYIALFLAAALGCFGVAADSHGEEGGHPTSDASVKVPWLTSIDKATARSEVEGKAMLLLFTGSDWCPACRVLDHRLETDPQLATQIVDQTIPVYLDFPTFELPEGQREHNEVLQARFQVPSLPTILFVDSELRLLGRYQGTGDELGEAAKRSTLLIADMQQALGGTGWQSCDNASQLAAALSMVPSENLARGWEPQVERLVALSREQSPELHTTWSAILDRVRTAKYLAKVEARYKELFQQGTEKTKVLQYLDDEIAAANQSTALLEVLFEKKSYVLGVVGQRKQAIDVAQQGLALDSLSIEYQDKLESSLAKLYAEDDQIDAARAILHARYSRSPEMTASELEQKVAYQLGQRLLWAGKVEAGIAELEAVLNEVEPGSEQHDSLVRYLTSSYDLVGHDPYQHAKMLHAWALLKTQEKSRRAANYSAKAAYLFQAAGAVEQAKQAWELHSTLKGPSDESNAPKSVNSPDFDPDSCSRGEAYLLLANTAIALIKGSYQFAAAQAFAEEGDKVLAQESIDQVKSLLADLEASGRYPQQVKKLRAKVDAWNSQP